MPTKYKKVPKPAEVAPAVEKPATEFTCPGCGWDWDTIQRNAGECPNCKTKYETHGWPVFKIIWFPETKAI